MSAASVAASAGSKRPGADRTHGRGAGRDREPDRVVRRALVAERREELREQDVARADARHRLDVRRERTHAPASSDRRAASAKQPFSSVMRTLRAPISAIASSAMRKSSSSSSSCPTSCSASRWFGRDEERAGLDPEAKRLPLRVEDDADVAAREIANRVGVERRRDLARKRAGQDDEVRAAREVVELLDERLELAGGDLGAPLVDLRVCARGGIHDGSRRPRLGGDPHEVVEDRLGR